MGGVGGGSELAERLRHQPRLQPDVSVAHVAFEFCPGHESGDAVHDDNVHGAAAHEVLHDLQRLLAGVRLRDEERVHLHAALCGVGGVQCVLSVYVGGGAAATLRFRDDVAAERGLSCGLRSEYLGDPPLRDPSYAQGQVQRDGARGDGFHVQALGGFSQPHDRSVPELPFYLPESQCQRLFLVRHVLWPRLLAATCQCFHRITPASAG